MFAMPWSPGEKQLRQFAWACLPGFALIGLAVYRATGSVTAGVILAGVGVVLWVAGVVRPTVLRVPWLLMMLVAAPIGWVVIRVAMIGFFGLVLVPLALVFRIAGRDGLRLRAREGWQTPAARGRPADYYRMG